MRDLLLRPEDLREAAAYELRCLATLDVKSLVIKLYHHELVAVLVGHCILEARLQDVVASGDYQPVAAPSWE